MFSRRVTCKNCGFKGVVEAQDTRDMQAEKIFKLLGKDMEGYIHLQCPTCGMDNSFGPTEFMSPLVKILGLLVLGAILYVIIRLIFK